MEVPYARRPAAAGSGTRRRGSSAGTQRTPTLLSLMFLYVGFLVAVSALTALPATTPSATMLLGRRAALPSALGAALGAVALPTAALARPLDAGAAGRASLLTAISDDDEEAAKVATAVIAGAVIVSPYIGIVTVQKLISNAADDELK